MDKKELSIVIICVALLFLLPTITEKIWPTPKANPQSKSANGTNQVSTAQAPGQSASSGSSLQTSTSGSKPVTTASGIPVSSTTIPEGKTISLENEQMKVEFTSTGGGIKEVVLKKFAEKDGLVSLNNHSPMPILDAEFGKLTFLKPFDLKQVSPTQVDATITTADGLRVTKSFSLESNYVVQTTLNIQNTGAVPISNVPLKVSLGTATPLDQRDLGAYIGLSYYSADKVIHSALSSVETEIRKQNKTFQRDQTIDWAAVKDQYFITIVTPSTPFAGLQSEVVTIPQLRTDDPRVKEPIKGVVGTIYSAPMDLAPGGNVSLNFSVYTGPKDHPILSTQGKHQEQSLDLGMFGSVLLWLMSFFHDFLHNWGWSIVAVTVMLKIIFWPLTAISTRSMKQMQALGPKVNALKEKYKDNTQKLNEEMMKLYRENGVNPLAGCLPMIVQIPIFIGFYGMLRGAVELRGAHFVWWVKDLSMPDTVYMLPLPSFLANSDFLFIHLGSGIPINPLPLIMVCTQIWQAKITPQAPNADPSMKMMMWFMPAMFLFICYNFSSGLSLYWTVQNLLTIAQTYYTKDNAVELPQKSKRKGGFTFNRPT